MAYSRDRQTLTSFKGDTTKVLTGSADNTCKIWDCETGRHNCCCLIGRLFSLIRNTFENVCLRSGIVSMLHISKCFAF